MLEHQTATTTTRLRLSLVIVFLLFVRQREEATVVWLPVSFIRNSWISICRTVKSVLRKTQEREYNFQFNHQVETLEQ